MLERIPTVLSAQEILDKAFQRSKKLEVHDPVRYHRIRKTFATRMQSFADTVAETLERYPKAFPNLDHVGDYNVAVLDILVGLPKLRKSLGSIRWAAGKVRDVTRQTMAQVAKVRRDESQFHDLQKRLYGRISDLVYEVGGDLELLAQVRDTVRVLPTVSPDYATVVIAGYPNVGKTSLLRAWTATRAEVNQYSFTTKRAEVGHFEVEDAHGVQTKYQVVDTPGLLDRPDEERNPIERQAIAALRHAADAVLFLIDPTETSGYGRAQQEALLVQVQGEMSGVPFIVAETKADLGDGSPSQPDRIRFSTVTRAGLPALQEAVVEALRFEELDLEVDPLEKWHKPAAEEW